MNSPLQRPAITFRHVLVLACCLAISATVRAQEAGDEKEDIFAVDRVTSGESPAGGRREEAGRMKAIPTKLSEMFVAGGPLMYALAACSILTLSFGIERLVVLRRRRVIPKDFVQRFLEHIEQGKLDRASALHLCEENGSPIAEVFAHGVRKWGKPSVEVEQAIIDGGERQIGSLRKHLRLLHSISTLTPLIGLLGTVYGMIMCFNEVAGSSAMGKSEKLAGGIGIALICTAGGLAVAIPALVLYSYLAGRVDALVMEMDSLGQRVVNYISAEGLTTVAAAPRASSKPKSVVFTEKDTLRSPPVRST